MSSRVWKRERCGTLAILALCVGAIAVVLSGCGRAEDLAAKYREGGGENYISGDGSIREIPEATRGEPIQFEGSTTHGGDFKSIDADDDVMVVNFWYAACAPCRVEAPLLESVSRELRDNVTFVGVNVRDSVANAVSFEEELGVAYPSILDRDAGAVLLAFAGEVPPAAVPTTIVLDENRRIAARVLGAVSDPSVLKSLIVEATE